MDKDKEIILAVPDKIVRELHIPEGVSTLPVEEIAVIMSALTSYTIADERGKFEGNPTFRQFIPYISVQCGNKFFNAVRTKQGGDARLHGKRLIGFGGHANPVEGDFIKTLSAKLRANAVREMGEELDTPHGFSLFFKGFINDYSIPVNKDHLGIYMTAVVDTEESVTVKETSVLIDSHFSTIAEIKEMTNYPLESWSEMLLGVIEPHVETM